MIADQPQKWMAATRPRRLLAGCAPRFRPPLYAAAMTGSAHNPPMGRRMGRPVGVVVLDTRFPRPLGDIGNPATFDGAVVYWRLSGAGVEAAVTASGIGAAVAEETVTATRALEAEGVGLISTSCGFLGELQDRLAEAVSIPVLSSALVLVPAVKEEHGSSARIGVLTFDSRTLSPRHFGGHYDSSFVVEGIESGRELYPAIAEDRPTLDVAAAEADAAEAAGRLRRKAGRLDAVILECTNLSPYAAAVRAAAGAPVYDLVGAIRQCMTEARP